MKVFMTGGTGYIGQSVVERMRQCGWEVVALVRRPESPQAVALANRGAQLVQGDITDVESMRAAMQGADDVLHNAGAFEFGVSGKAKQQMYEINVNGTENVLHLAQELGIPRTIYVSTTWVYGATGAEVRDETFQRNAPFRSYYEETKTKAHEIALRYQREGLPLIIVCPHGVVGANDYSANGYFLRLYLNGMMPPLAWGPDTVFSLVHKDDLADGMVLAVEKGQIGETYIFAGEPMVRRDMVALWMTKPGGFKVRFYIPSWLAWIMFAPLEPLQRMVGLPAFISRETVRISVNHAFTSRKAKEQLGWTHRSAQQMWLDTIEAELELRNQRDKRHPLAMLKPM